ncbi:hypothetical protein KY290_006914 [Solanum tuberosum]|uniref:Uncharacterized protein n=1 Tax=Solanum tuberosum TaxID=4113 RepID=A0ABQ7W455_SOLTU|nr:hypothetical protein KY284_006953 [Solanum tuberosum]KAH0745103.1 hypothetical protein KY285_006760 [Solanum tuberosum]KAH0775503.1 hypothetical protein KY290_006914 [Solanum tuberosum]
MLNQVTECCPVYNTFAVLCFKSLYAVSVRSSRGCCCRQGMAKSAPPPHPMTKFCCQPAPLARFKLLTYCLRNPSFLQPNLQSISASTIL